MGIKLYWMIVLLPKLKICIVRISLSCPFEHPVRPFSSALLRILLYPFIYLRSSKLLKSRNKFDKPFLFAALQISCK
jgi:hypothetical protein